MRNRFNEQLSQLNTELITMGALCEEAISKAAKYLIDNDESLKETIFETDRQIDQKERDIENLCMRLLLQQQPVARDLRTISSALKMISDMERIGDQASDIAEIVCFVNKSGIGGKVHIADMARSTIAMVTNSVESFVKNDADIAYDVIKQAYCGYNLRCEYVLQRTRAALSECFKRCKGTYICCGFAYGRGAA